MPASRPWGPPLLHELFALDTELDLEEGASREQLEDGIEGHVLGGAELIGTYERT